MAKRISDRAMRERRNGLDLAMSKVISAAETKGSAEMNLDDQRHAYWKALSAYVDAKVTRALQLAEGRLHQLAEARARALASKQPKAQERRPGRAGKRA